MVLLLLYYYISEVISKKKPELFLAYLSNSLHFHTRSAAPNANISEEGWQMKGTLFPSGAEESDPNQIWKNQQFQGRKTLSWPTDARGAESKRGSKVSQPASTAAALLLLGNNLKNIYKDSSLLNAPARMEWLIYSALQNKMLLHIRCQNSILQVAVARERSLKI